MRRSFDLAAAGPGWSPSLGPFAGLRQEHTGPTVGCLKRLGRLERSLEQICSGCSAVLEAFGAAQTLSALIQHAKSEEVGWLSECQLYDNWWCASKPTQCVGGTEYCARFVFLCTFHHFLFSCSATHLLHLVQAQNVHTTVELAARRSGVFNATLLLNGSDKRQQSGWIKTVDCWFESEWCMGAFRVRVLLPVTSSAVLSRKAKG